MTLDDRFLLTRGRVYLTGIQALVRLPLDQVRRDRLAGLNTAAFISGYEGSPLGGYDIALNRAQKLLGAHRVHFVPAVNEELAATAVMGTQMLEAVGGARVDGVLGIWYGKGPGLDRSGDALRHANLAGTGPRSAALVLAGDDHASKSSTIPHQSDLSLYNLGIPVFCPGNAQEILDYGLMAVALSRFSGAWVALKLVTGVCDGGGTVDVDPALPSLLLPEGYVKHTGARLLPPFSLKLEEEVVRRRLEAAREFASLNRVNRWFGAAGNARLGIAAAGKSYYDLAQALRDLGIAASDLTALRVRIGKFAMTFPLDRRFLEEFAQGLETILVIEEKRSFLELQLREALYNLPSRPVVIGKEDEAGRPLVPATGELDPDGLARVLAARLLPGVRFAPAEKRLRTLEEIDSRPHQRLPSRPPNYCPGCPHNRSTILLEGQVTGGGIGCHGMGLLLQDVNRGYAFITQMGGEGAPWIGMAPFVERRHIFQNLGDGTYFHSAALAIQACIAAGVNITYKILYNGAVAMTGGQPVIGALPVPELTRKLEAEGVRKTVVLVDDLSRYPDPTRFASGAELQHRRRLPEVLRELERTPGVTVLIYDQLCAAEKRRLRSRGLLEEPALRLVINEEVCEGCGDCVTESNCMSLYPVQTEFGPKLRIHQSSCNKDYTCLLGDCPSFVTVRLKPGVGLRKRELPPLPPAEVPGPAGRVSAGDGYRIISPGVGGTGVVTVNALLATAALLDGLHVVTLDQTGLAQKGGAVVSHLLLSERPIEASARTNAGNADLLLGLDLLGAGHPRNLDCAHPERTAAVVNTAAVPTGEMIRGLAPLAGAEPVLDAIRTWTRRDRTLFLDATRLAETLFASHMSANVLLLGAAWQAGWIPVSSASIEQAIRLNAVEVERNLAAFRWGRMYHHDPRRVEQFLPPQEPAAASPDPVERRAAELAAYQNRAYAASYLDFVRRVEARQPALKEAVARSLYKLMAYKDEYEVARLLTRPQFERRLEDMWEAIDSVGYNLCPPFLRAFGLKEKLSFGPWFRLPLRALARLKFLRGTPLDPFGYATVRRKERALVGWYRALVEELLVTATPANLPLALEIASLPEEIRGYERIKLENIWRVERAAGEKVATLSAAAAAVASDLP